MINEEVAMVTEVSSGIRPVTAEESVGVAGVQKEPEDLFSGLNRRQKTDAANILAALACLTVGSGPEDV